MRLDCKVGVMFALTLGVGIWRKRDRKGRGCMRAEG